MFLKDVSHFCFEGDNRFKTYLVVGGCDTDLKYNPKVNTDGKKVLSVLLIKQN